MLIPEPAPGLVIRYAYLWPHEAATGREEGAKDRPCAIVLTVEDDMGQAVVTVVPISTSRPADPLAAVELPGPTKRRLGLDADRRSWVIVDSINRFVWPGPDLRPIKGGKVDYGYLPPRLFEQIKQALQVTARRRKLQQIDRSA